MQTDTQAEKTNKRAHLCVYMQTKIDEIYVHTRPTRSTYDLYFSSSQTTYTSPFATRHRWRPPAPPPPWRRPSPSPRGPWRGQTRRTAPTLWGCRVRRGRVVWWRFHVPRAYTDRAGRTKNEQTLATGSLVEKEQSKAMQCKATPVGKGGLFEEKTSVGSGLCLCWGVALVVSCERMHVCTAPPPVPSGCGKAKHGSKLRARLWTAAGEKQLARRPMLA